MNIPHRPLLAALSLCLVGLPTQAGRYMESVDVTASALYTGARECQSLGYRPAREWQARLNAEQQRKSRLEMRGFFVEDAELNRVVNGVAEKLVRSFPGRCPDVNVFVVAQGSPMMYEAMTSSLGEIFVHYGVLKQAETEDELAAVIAHELAHVYLGHIEKLDFARDISNYVDISTNLMEVYTAVDKTDYNEDTRRLESDEEQIKADMRQVSHQRKLARRHYQALHASAFSRSAELDADRFAVDLLVEAGYSPVAMTVVLRRIGESYESIEKLQKEAAEAAEALMVDNLEYLASTDAGNASMNEHAMETARTTLNSLQEQGESWLNDVIRSTHPQTEKRLEEINKYLLGEFSRQERRPPRRAPVLAARGGRVGEIVANMEAANEAYVALASGDLPVAEKSALRAISGPTTSNAYSRYIAFNVRSEQGKDELALRNLQLIDDSEWMPVHATEEITALLIAREHLDSAAQIVKAKESYARESDFLYPVRITLLQAEGKQDAGVALARECVGRKGIANAIAEQCRDIAGIESALPKDSPLGIISGALKRLPFGRNDD